MIEIKERYECTGCGACKNICPRNAIEMKADENEFKYPVVDTIRCSDCNMCTLVCPVKKSKENEHYLKVYAAKNLKDDIRCNSTSGGIFSIIAEYIINNNGVVFGVGFDEEFNAEHSYIDNLDDIRKFRGSKYIQSDTKNTYKDVKRFLLEGRKVLFSGTPCQIEGVKSFLGKEYDNLYLQDCICHGVPSKKLFREYLINRVKLDGKNIIDLKDIKFRSKKELGWTRYSVNFIYDDMETSVEQKKDEFMQLFLSDQHLRDSCYNCKFRKKYRESDITLADFWGIDNIFPEFNDEKGISLIMINSAKGQELFYEIKENSKIIEVDFDEAIKGNPSTLKSPKKII